MRGKMHRCKDCEAQTNKKCFTCGAPVCANCSEVRPYEVRPYTVGLRRACAFCLYVESMDKPRPRPRPLTLNVFQQLFQGKNCTHEYHNSIVYFHARCHPTGKTWAFFDRTKNTITIECAVCRKRIVEVTLEHT
jgi:hypothetical protein